MSLATLPEVEGDRLINLRETDRRKFLVRVRALVDAGWPLRAVGEPLGAGRSTVRAWKFSPAEERPGDLDDLPEIPRRGRLQVIRMHPDVPEEERDTLIELSRAARNVNRWTPPNAPERRASQELNRKLQTYVDRGVPVRTLANHMGVTYRAVVARLERGHDKVAV